MTETESHVPWVTTKESYLYDFGPKSQTYKNDVLRMERTEENEKLLWQTTDSLSSSLNFRISPILQPGGESSYLLKEPFGKKLAADMYAEQALSCILWKLWQSKFDISNTQIKNLIEIFFGAKNLDEQGEEFIIFCDKIQSFLRTVKKEHDQGFFHYLKRSFFGKKETPSLKELQKVH